MKSRVCLKVFANDCSYNEIVLYYGSKRFTQDILRKNTYGTLDE